GEPSELLEPRDRESGAPAVERPFDHRACADDADQARPALIARKQSAHRGDALLESRAHRRRPAVRREAFEERLDAYHDESLDAVRLQWVDAGRHPRLQLLCAP